METKNNGPLADVVFGLMDKDGFTMIDYRGAPGHEVVTFKYARGDVRTVKFYQ